MECNSVKPSLIRVKYLDHVLFRNADPSHLKPPVREAIGWLVEDREDSLVLIYDRSVMPLPFERFESGLVILKSDILEVEKIE